MATVFDSMLIRRVFYQIGKFSNSGRPRFQEAPFSFVQIPSLSADQYIQPLSFAMSNESNAANLNASDWVSGSDEAIFRTGEGYQDLERMILAGKHIMGDWQGRGDDVMGMHRFDYL